MEEGFELALSAAGNRLSFLFESRPYPDSDSAWDRDSIKTIVKADTPTFHGRFQTLVWSRELAALLRTLQELRQQVGESVEVTFELLEATVGLSFYLRRDGHLDVQVVARPDPGTDTMLQFTIKADQTYLPIWSREIEAVLEMFPVELETRLS